MQVRLPRPLRGWREFAGEVGIIVLGVGIALGAEQMLEGEHWRQVVEAEDKALVQEIQDNYGALLVRVMVQPCIDRRLAELAEVFRRHDAGQPLGLVAPIGRPSRFTGSTTTLEMATADQSLSHMALDRKQTIFDTYGSYDIYLSVAAEERAGWRALQSLDRAASLEDADWRELRKAYDGVVDNNATMKANMKSERDGQWLTAFALFPKPDTAALRENLLSLPYVRNLCRPALRRES
jgi:hypothetical protein